VVIDFWFGVIDLMLSIFSIGALFGLCQRFFVVAVFERLSNLARHCKWEF